jgi:hypothetical protein
LISGKHRADNMDEIQHLATQLKTDPDNLDGWHRLSQLVDDPEKKQDCQNQVTRIENKSRGFDEIVPCENCGTWMLIYDDQRKHQKAATCCSCGAQKVLETYEQESELPTQDAITIWVSIASILGGNLIPVIYVLYFNWDVGSLVILYWIENLIIGFYTVLKLLFIKAPITHTREVILFCTLYGLFCLNLGMILLAMFYPIISYAASRPGYFIEIIWPILGLFISHGISFIQNRKEYAMVTPDKITSFPYVRVIPIYLALALVASIIRDFGGSIGALINSVGAVGVFILFIIFKTMVELLPIAQKLAGRDFFGQTKA